MPWLAVLPVTAAVSTPALPPPPAHLKNAADAESACPASAHTRFSYRSQPAMTAVPHHAAFLGPVCPPASCSTHPRLPWAWRPSASQPSLSPAVSSASQAAADR